MQNAEQILELKRGFESKRDEAITELIAERDKINTMLAELGYEPPKKRRAKRAPKAENAAKTAGKGK
jgi:hypothetical protein